MTPPPIGRVRRSLSASLWDGVFASVMVGLWENFLIPFALALYATPMQVSAVASFPQLFGALTQFWTAPLTRFWGSRKGVLVRLADAQALGLALFAGLPFLPAEARGFVMVVLAVAYAVFGGVLSPVWNSLMTEYLPPNRRATYFGRRNRVLGWVVVATGLLSGLLLQSFREKAVWGFSLLFVVAGVCRFLSARFLSRMFEPSAARHNLSSGDIREFLEATRFGPFWPLVFFSGGITFAANLSGPYFAVYMLKGLGFSYFTYTVVMMTVTLSTLHMMGVWGRVADESGPLSVIRLCAWLTPTLPLVWLFPRTAWHVIPVQIFAGFVWSGFNLCTVTYLFDAVPSRLRTQAISYFNVVSGVAIFGGAAIGGYLLHVLPPFMGSTFLSLLMVSWVFRVASCVFLLPRVPTVRLHQEVPSWESFYGAFGLRPVLGLTRDVVNFLFRMER